MTKTNWSRFSNLVLACVLVLAAAGPAVAVSVGSTDVTEEAEVGSQVSATVTLDELYKDPQLEAWTLAGETDLTDVTWTVVYYDQTGAKVDQESFDGQTFSGARVAESDGTSDVEVRVTGTVPEVDAYSYDPPQSFTVAALTQTRQGGSSNQIDAWTAHYYTADSESARAALDEAQAAIESANASGANTDDARESFENAINAYENANFDLATTLAEEAQTNAQQASQSKQTTQLAIYAVGGLVVVALLVGGFLWYRSQQQTYDKLG